MQKYTMDPVVGAHQRGDFRALGSSPEQNDCEIRVKNIMLQLLLQN